MKRIAIIGAGGFGREVKTLIDDINRIAPTYDFIGFYDDNVAKGTMVNGYQVLGNLSNLNAELTSLEIALGIGNPDAKAIIVGRITNPRLNYPTLIHPSVIKGADQVEIGKGCVICAGSILTCNIVVGDYVTINLMCTVGHDSVIENFCSFMPSVNISGEVVIRSKVYVGTGAKIINQLEIGDCTIVGAGAVVSKSLPESCTAVGIPAKPIKFHNTSVSE